MSMTTRFFILFFCAFWAITVHASKFNYHYVEIGYSQTSIDSQTGTPDIDGDTFSLLGSFSISQKINAIVSYRISNFDYNLDTNIFEIGAGIHTPLTRNTDAYFTATAVDAKVETDTPDRSDDTGYAAKAGLRFSSRPNVEVTAFAGHTNIFEQSENSFGVGARLKFGNDRDFGIVYTRGDDTSDIALSFRMNM